MNKIYYIMGKSASGKDHIYENLLQNDRLGLKPLILYTTRPMREGEKNGREYYFVTEKEFNELLSEKKIIEYRTYQTIHGPWIYFTADQGQVSLEKSSYLGIGTLESYKKLVEYYGKDAVSPIYIEVEDGIRLKRALTREEKQKEPKYREMCRRYLADCEDFSEERIKAAGIERRFFNNRDLSECIQEIIAEILSL